MKALTGTIIFHIVLLVCFMFFGLSTPLPLPEEEGVLVVLGHHDEGTGHPQPLPAPRPSAPPAPEQPDVAEEEVLTQTIEETISIPDTKSPEPEEDPRPEPVEDKPERDDSPVQEEVAKKEPEPEPEPDPRALFPGRDERTAEQEGRGESGVPGIEGRPEGSPEGEAATGGKGSGVEFSLSGRRANYLPMPDYTSPETGRVVVSIRVNRQGQVTRAEAGERGTTTTNQTLWRLAEEAARKAKFDLKQDAPEEQRGTITYNFIRLN